MLDLVIVDYKISRKRSLADLTSRVEKNIRPGFCKVRAGVFSSSTADRYIENRREAGASDSTINRELAIVRRAFSLGMQSDPPMVHKKPHIRRLDEDNARGDMAAWLDMQLTDHNHNWCDCP